jgi:hypothetical protein
VTLLTSLQTHVGRPGVVDANLDIDRSAFLSAKSNRSRTEQGPEPALLAGLADVLVFSGESAQSRSTYLGCGLAVLLRLLVNLDQLLLSQSANCSARSLGDRIRGSLESTPVWQATNPASCFWVWLQIYS